MSQEVSTVVASPALVLTAQEVKAHIQRIQQVMKAVMKDGVHYGKIPGAGDRRSLFKPGAETLCTTFRIAPSYRVEDLSDHDQVRYRVTCLGTHQSTGVILGEGMGEASSNEEKYRWRNAVCDEEFEEAAEDRKRVKWQRGQNGAWQRKQVRTEPADIANTVLKMACKRAQVAMVINVTAASDIFSQDLEDLPPEMLGGEEGDGQHNEHQQRTARPAQQQRSAPQAPRSTGGNGHATEKQVKLLHARIQGVGMPETEFCEHFGIGSVSELPFSKVNDALAFIDNYGRAA